MEDRKRRRGGPRPNSGGARPGAGRPRQRLTLDKATAHTLAVLTRQRRQVAPATTEENVVAELVAQAWQELDREFQERETPA